MALPLQPLDDRRFQDIVDELKKRISLYCPEWTDHNVSDPGVTLIELFAWVADLLLYRINRIPDLHYIKFMDMLGIRLQPPSPAQADVTFYLAEPQTTMIEIKAGTEVSTTQTEIDRPVIFTTDKSFRIQPPQLDLLIRGRKTGEQENFELLPLDELYAGRGGGNIFTTTPQAHDALYFGFKNDLSYHVLRLVLDFDPNAAIGIIAEKPPYIWEVSSGVPGEWIACDKEDVKDETKGMNERGQFEIHLPVMGELILVREQEDQLAGQAEDQRARQPLFWLRVRVRQPSAVEQAAGMRPYERSPHLLQIIEVASIGGTMPATNAITLARELLGTSDGAPGQRFLLSTRPVLKRQPHEHLEMTYENQPDDEKAWHEVDYFSGAESEGLHYTLDSATGELLLGPAVPQPDGTILCYGRVPPRGATLHFTQYRTGGGARGNVPKGAINRLKSSIPFIDRVRNRKPAKGGMDAQSIEAAKLAVPGLLRTRERAVTREDYQTLVRSTFASQIARVYCLAPMNSSNQVQVILVPYPVPALPGQLNRPAFDLDEKVRKAVHAYLDEHRMLTVRLSVNWALIRWISVRVVLTVAPGVDQPPIRQAVQESLQQFLDPLTGGREGTGWPLGRKLTKYDIERRLNSIPIVQDKVQKIETIELRTVDPDQSTSPQLFEEITLADNASIASAEHEVKLSII